jgi:hypothetical protein
MHFRRERNKIQWGLLTGCRIIMRSFTLLGKDRGSKGGGGGSQKAIQKREKQKTVGFTDWLKENYEKLQSTR